MQMPAPNNVDKNNRVSTLIKYDGDKRKSRKTYKYILMLCTVQYFKDRCIRIIVPLDNLTGRGGRNFLGKYYPYVS